MFHSTRYRFKFLASSRNDASLADALSPSQLAEGQEMLNFILQTRSKLLGQGHIATGEVKYCIGLLHLHMGNASEARQSISFACDVYSKHLGPEHPSTRDAYGTLQSINTNSNKPEEAPAGDV